jgi:hypothetical protein
MLERVQLWLEHDGGKDYLEDTPEFRRELRRVMSEHGRMIQFAAAGAETTFDVAKWVGSTLGGFSSASTAVLLALHLAAWPITVCFASVGFGAVFVAFQRHRFSKRWSSVVLPRLVKVAALIPEPADVRGRVGASGIVPLPTSKQPALLPEGSGLTPSLALPAGPAARSPAPQKAVRRSSAHNNGARRRADPFDGNEGFGQEEIPLDPAVRVDPVAVDPAEPYVPEVPEEGGSTRKERE